MQLLALQLLQSVHQDGFPDLLLIALLSFLFESRQSPLVISLVYLASDRFSITHDRCLVHHFSQFSNVFCRNFDKTHKSRSFFHIFPHFFQLYSQKTTFPVFPAGLFCPLTSSRFQYPKPRKSVKSRTKEFAKFSYKVIIALDINNRMHVLRTFYCHESRKNKAGTYHV